MKYLFLSQAAIESVSEKRCSEDLGKVIEE